MPAGSLPFWVITEREHILSPPAEVPCADASALIAFSSTEKLTAYLKARVGGRWEIHLVAGSESIILLIADAHRIGTNQVCFNCEPDGSGGELVDIRELIDGAELRRQKF